jgi:hypothetical protein
MATLALIQTLELSRVVSLHPAVASAMPRACTATWKARLSLTVPAVTELGP